VVRRLTLLDATTLIAATGIGLAVVRVYSPEWYTSPYRPSPAPSLGDWASVVLSNWAYYLSPIPAAWTLAVLALRLRHPRPIRRRLMREPGMTAGCAAAGAIALGAVHYLLDRVSLSLRHSGRGDSFELMSLWAGIAVGAAWLCLGLSGRWTSEPSWLDRSGRLLGLYWVSMIPLALARLFSGY
jgi:hypothetical protein